MNNRNILDKNLLIEEQKKFLDIDYDILEKRNFVTDTYFRDKETFNFMIYTAAIAYGTEYYHPYFPGIDNSKILQDILQNIKSKTFTTTYSMNHVDKIPDISQFVPEMKMKKTDTELKLYSLDLYKFFCFTINFNNIILYPQNNKMWRVQNIMNENKNNDINEEIVFHGTKKTRLYSIIRNGAKCLHSIQNGRSYGDGFYCTTNIDMAKTYSDSFILVYKLKNADKYVKGHAVYVVPDVENLELLYIIPRNIRTADAITIREKKIINQANELQKNSSMIRSKRLVVDMKKCIEYFSENPDHGIKIDIDDQQMYTWKVYFTRFSSDTLLFQDMKKYGISQITLETEFKEDYPFSPPFVRVLCPRFERWTGHVTYGGSLCTEFLTLTDTPYSWKPILSITTVFLMIKELLSLDGRLDAEFYKNTKNIQKTLENKSTYSKNEASEAFQIALRKHGWKN